MYGAFDGIPPIPTGWPNGRKHIVLESCRLLHGILALSGRSKYDLSASGNKGHVCKQSRGRCCLSVWERYKRQFEEVVGTIESSVNQDGTMQ